MTERLVRHPDGRWVDWKDLPCKDRSSYVRADGGCIKCDADAGVICHASSDGEEQKR